MLKQAVAAVFYYWKCWNKVRIRYGWGLILFGEPFIFMFYGIKPLLRLISGLFQWNKYPAGPYFNTFNGINPQSHLITAFSILSCTLFKPFKWNKSPVVIYFSFFYYSESPAVHYFGLFANTQPYLVLLLSME